MPATLLVAAFALLFAAAPRAQDGVRLLQVPPHLELPAAAGANLLLEAAVSGAPTAVFLAADPQSARAPLTAAGDGRYQLNLADPAVARILRAPEIEALFVFADGDGPRRRSTAIRFARADLPPAALRCAAVLAGTATPVPVPRRRFWLDPGQVERFEVAGEAPGVTLLAHMGNTDCPLVRDPARAVWTLPIDDAKRAAWRAAGQLELVAQRGAEIAQGFRIEAVPERLEIEDRGADFSIAQRGTGFVPGSREFLRVRVGDITGGQALLEIRAADGSTPVPQRSVRSYEQVEFALGGARYVLVVRRLVNFLIGEDIADLTVVAAERHRAGPIGLLLQRIATADVMFVREGQSYDGEEAARFLRAKLDASRREVSVDEFIDQIASRSSRTGDDYLVRLPDGSTVKASTWLRQELQRLDRAGGR